MKGLTPAVTPSVYWDEAKRVWLEDGPDAVAASAHLDLASEDPVLRFRVRLGAQPSANFLAKVFVRADLDSTPVTLSYRPYKGLESVATLGR